MLTNSRIPTVYSKEKRRTSIVARKEYWNPQLIAKNQK
jgi:hypothetical protein